MATGQAAAIPPSSYSQSVEEMMSERRRRPLPQRKRPATGRGRGNGRTERTRAPAGGLWRTSGGEDAAALGSGSGGGGGEMRKSIDDKEGEERKISTGCG